MSTWKAVRSGSCIVFQHRRVKLLWEQKEGKLSFRGIREAARRGRGFTFGTGAPLWRLELRDRAGYPTRLDGSDAHGFSYRAGRLLVFRWTALADGKADVILRVGADENRPITRWGVEVVNHSAEHTVWSMAFGGLPDVLGPTRSHRDDVLIKPEGFGCAIPDPIRQERLSVWGLKSYPSGIQAMPFVALLNGPLGLYLGSHDPAFALCDFDVNTDRAADRISMQIGFTPQDSGRAQRRIPLGGEIVLGLFEGDWFDAAGIYREWAEGQRTFRTPVARRRDIPQWAREIPLWIQLGLSNEPTVPASEMRRKADVATALRDALGSDIAIHLYNWHRNPFDISYPSYRPRPGLKGFVRRCQRSGVRVMPYINGRLFDPDNPDWKRENARRWAVKLVGAKLDPKAEHLQLEDYGSHALFAPMCPATRYWQRKIAGVVRDIVRGLGVDAVYIDQIAAASPAPCADPAHGHPLRNGAWWVRGYEEMLRQTRRRLPGNGKGILLTTECNAEPYLGFVGGLLMWHSVRNFVVPLFPAVHGGRALLYGRSAPLKDRTAFRIGAAQDVLWGCQMGWFGVDDAERLLKPGFRGELDLLRRLCGLYSRLRPYFHAGRMLRPPRVHGRVEQVRTAWSYSGWIWREAQPVVQAARWHLDGRTATALVNTHAQPQSFRLSAGGSASVWWAAGVEGRVSFSRRDARVHMPPLSALLLTQRR